MTPGKLLAPQEHTFETLWGLEAGRALVPRLLAANRMPHAMLLTGPDGIGKRSLAFAMAKCLLSVGRPVPESSMTAPGLAKAKRKIAAPPPDAEEDLFGFAEAPPPAPEPPPAAPAEPDLFASIEEPSFPPLPPAPEPKLPPPPPPPAAVPQAVAPLSQEPPRPLPPAKFIGLNPRVCRLIQNSYPVEFDKEGRPANNACLDLTIIEPPEGKRSVLVDQIRYLQEIARLQPVEGNYRVALIFGADTITEEGANSILKLLEEPPPSLIMILVANRLNRVLPTIRSRCAQVVLSAPERDVLLRKLTEELGIEASLAKVAASLAENRPGVALRLVASNLLKGRREVFESRLQIDRYGKAAIPAAAGRIVQTGPLEESLWMLLSFARDRLVHQFAPDHPELLTHGDVKDLIAALPPEPFVLDTEADALLAAYGALAHPYIPNQRIILERAFWEVA